MTTPIPRKTWGARYRDGFRDRPMPISEYWLHHSLTLAPDLLPPFDDDDEAVRTLERIGQDRFGGGISYTYPVTPVGRLYQGLSLNRQGAHTLGHNTKAAAFVLVGDYRKRPPTGPMVEAIARRMVEDHRAGDATRHTLNGGHRQASQNVGTTECPGDAALAAIPAINARANQLWDAGWPNTNGEDEYMPTAEEIRDAVWDAQVTNVNGKRIRVGDMVGQAGRAAIKAEATAAAALEVIRALAAADGSSLTPDQVEAAAERGAARALDERIREASVDLVVDASQDGGQA